VGAGLMGRAWLQAVQASGDVELGCVVDVAVDVGRRAVAELGLPEVPVLAALAEVDDLPERPQAVIDVTVPEAHLPVTLEALALGLPVLGEKPAAATLAGALVLADAAERAGELFMVSQSRRYDGHLAGLKARLPEIGEVGIVTTEFFRAPRFGGFRDEMAHPLLLDMAIHAFDAARHLVGAEPVAVRCEEFNPSWSWYAGAAAATASFEFTGGVRYLYRGSWCSPGRGTSWNGFWRVSASGGSAEWDGDGPARLYPADGAEEVPCPPVDVPEGIAGALAEFVHALRTGEVPSGEVHDNIHSLAMVHAAVESAATGRRAVLADVIQRASPAR